MDLYYECNDGWKDIVEDTHRYLSILIPGYKTDQIKEKFGELRYYWTPPDGENNPNHIKMAEMIVDAAEIKSRLTCEICGKNGKVISRNGWYKALCPEHEK